MKINYQKILEKNLINVFKDVLLDIESKGLQEGHHLYITFNTENPKVEIPSWLKKKHPKEMTIIIQYEFWNFKIKKNLFNIGLSFNDIKVDLKISFDSIISFSDPYANFGLKLKQENSKKKLINSKIEKKDDTIKNKTKDNIINFKEYKKN